MSRTLGASGTRLRDRLGACCLALGVLVVTVFAQGQGIATAQPGSPDGIAGLVAAVADANQKLQDLGAAIQTEQETVNKAIVDVESARDAAAAAQHEVDASQASLADANAAIGAAQQRFDTFAASTYVNGPSASYVTARDPSDVIDTVAAGQTLSVSSQQVMTDLQRARTEQVNRESAARLSKQNADAGRRRRTGQPGRGRQRAEIGSADVRVAAGRTGPAHGGTVCGTSQTRPGASVVGARARPADGADRQPARQIPAANWDRAPTQPAPAAANWDTGWDPTLPAIPSAFVSGDPIAIINGLLGIASTSSQVTSQMGHNFLSKLGLLPTASGFTNGAIPRVYGRQASEYVIQRAGSQMGVPYSWGGGTAAGPGRGH